MRLNDIYLKFKTPPNLQEHMLRVASVTLFIIDHWVGPKIDKELILSAALVHDLGNIVRFDFVNHPEFLGQEQKRLAYWISVQKEIVAKYGSDDHLATTKMLGEIEVNDKLVNLVLTKGFKNVLKIEKSDNWELKILFYADMRVGPYGILSLVDRLNEVINRWPEAERGKWMDHIEACKRIEKEIQEKVDINLQNLGKEILRLGQSLLSHQV
jgi:hypothetical protein